jgi:hypothetical protein
MPTISYKGRRIRLTQRMFDVLDYATKYPKPNSWHNIGSDATDKKTIARLEAEGLVEVAEHANQYRLTLRVLTIFDGLIFTLFEVRVPFRFLHAVGENGKRNWER